MRSKKCLYAYNPHIMLATKTNWHLLISRKVLREHGFEENSNCNSYIIEIYNNYIIVIRNTPVIHIYTFLIANFIEKYLKNLYNYILF